VPAANVEASGIPMDTSDYPPEMEDNSHSGVP